MLSRLNQTLIDVLRFELCQIPLPEDFVITDANRLVYLAMQHDLQHLVYHAMEVNHIPEFNQIDESSFNTSMFRYLRQQAELSKLYDLFEQEHITYVPLKGVVMRQWYPQPWMRSCADIDILIYKADLERAIILLKNVLRYKQAKINGFHDISFYSPDHDVHFELHYSLIEDGRVNDAIVQVLNRVWDYVTPVAEGSYHGKMTDEMLYFYHIAHMAKHFTRGGNCGIRYIMDLWLLNQYLKDDMEKRNALLTKAGLMTFAQKMSVVAESWFGSKQHSTNELLERYIIRNALHGSYFGSVAYEYYEKSENKWKIALYRVFPPTEILSKSYPMLNKVKALTPLFWGVRLCQKIVDPDARKRINTQYEALRKVKNEDATNYIQIMNELGL